MNNFLKALAILVIGASVGCAQKRSSRAVPVQPTDQAKVGDETGQDNNIATTFSDRVSPGEGGSGGEVDGYDGGAAAPGGSAVPGVVAQDLVFTLKDGRNINVDWDGQADRFDDVQAVN